MGAIFMAFIEQSNTQNRIWLSGQRRAEASAYWQIGRSSVGKFLTGLVIQRGLSFLLFRQLAGSPAIRSAFASHA